MNKKLGEKALPLIRLNGAILYSLLNALLRLNLRLKKSLVLSVSVFVGINLGAQNGPKLYGVHQNTNGPVFSALSLPGGNYSQIATVNLPFNPVSDKTTFDHIGSRYFFKNGNSILVINALNGQVVDSVLNAGNFHNIEYDQNNNSLVGIYINGNAIEFRTYNLNTKTWHYKNTLTLVDSITIGESTFDAAGRRYFTLTDVGMVVVDSTGYMTDVLCASPNLNGIEYNPGTNKIYYMEWNGNAYDFVCIEANTCTFGGIGFYFGLVSVTRASSTFDQSLEHYFCKTNFGILKLSITNGQVLETIVPSNNFDRIEYANLSTVGITQTNTNSQIAVFPNPSSQYFHFKGIETGSLVEIIDAKGNMVIREKSNDSNMQIDLGFAPKGLYFYRISGGRLQNQQGQLWLK